MEEMRKSLRGKGQILKPRERQKKRFAAKSRRGKPLSELSISIKRKEALPLPLPVALVHHP